MALRIVFFGTPAFAVPSLRRLLDTRHEVVGVVTQPDRPRGRGQAVTPEAVKVAAVECGVPVLQPARLGVEEQAGLIAPLAPDLGVVAAYGRLLPRALLDLPRLGMINVHASLLPRWRGAAPVHRAILAGDRTTGVTIMRVVLALDAGPMLARQATDIGPNETSAELETRLAAMGAELLIDVVDRLEGGGVPGEAQDERQVTYASKLTRADSHVDWARPADAIHNQIRGLQPWPLAAVTLHGRRLMLHRSTVEHLRPMPEAPGTIVAVRPDAMVVAAHPGAVALLAVQEAGRKVLAVDEYLRGRRVAPGDRVAPLPRATP